MVFVKIDWGAVTGVDYCGEWGRKPLRIALPRQSNAQPNQNLVSMELDVATPEGDGFSFGQER